MGEGSWVGLDVHARSVVAGVIDAGSGEVRSLRVPAGSDATVAWLATLPAPVRVVYEAGPTGIGLRVRVPRRGSAVLWRRRRGSGRRRIGSRLTGGTLSGWRGCFGWVRALRCGCRGRRRRPRVIWLGRGRMRWRSDAGPAPALEAVAPSRGGLRRDRVDAAHDGGSQAAVRERPLAIDRRGTPHATQRRGGRARRAIASSHHAPDARIGGRLPPRADATRRVTASGDGTGARAPPARPPSESQAGARRRRDHENRQPHARRPASRAPPRPRAERTLERRRTGKSLAVRAQADPSARRLHGRWHALEARGKPRSIVVVAVARELAGHCWALATME